MLQVRPDIKISTKQSQTICSNASEYYTLLMFLDHIIQELSNLFNQPVNIINHQPVFGGDINQTYRLQTNTGTFFLKLNDGKLNDMFEKEFSGLRLMHQTKTIKIPEPILHGKIENKIFLVTEFIEKGSSSKNFWQTFARQLAAMHRHTNERFGLPENNYIGSLHQPNYFCKTWSEFYAAQRIMPMMQLAFSQNKCSKEDVTKAEKLCERLSNIFPEEKPALIHGDLWGGNFMAGNNGEPVIYDPAVYYGNREMDIAMSLLFGGFDSSFYNHYNEAFPLQPGWQKRVELCQLYPLMVHLILFGGHYYHSVMGIISAYV
ncbi:fructosamine kinase family protein [Parafilimonas sp.]|uniref:fructosamine kinase family protein n=1 Tax=Parafilimonas sp. TaxID=1969739 RepID=UPI0039E6B496